MKLPSDAHDEKQPISNFPTKTAFGVSLSLESQHHPAIDWAKQMLGNILPYETSVISIMVGHLTINIEKNVRIEFIYPSRWQNGAESLWICLWSVLRLRTYFKCHSKCGKV